MKIKTGTRSRALALAQINIFIKELITLLPDLKIDIVKIRSIGDILYDQPLINIGGKSLFIKNRYAVHSMKDMPVDLPP